jgi:hypothetical protein
MLIVLVLLAISVLLDRYLVSVLCPWMPSLGGTSLMVVFLDIPVAMPTIDPLPVAVLFSLFYAMMPARQPGAEEGGLSSIWGGVFILACWMASGALLYHFTEGFLPRVVRNGIDSFGIHADINTPFMDYSTLHLRGGVILLICFILGGRPLLKRINHPVNMQPAPAPSQPEPAQVRRDIPVCTTIAAPPPTPVRPKTAVKSVTIVAPRPVELLNEKETAASTLY